MSKRPPMAKDLVEVVVAPDTYHVSPEPMLLVAELHGALGLCLHDEGRGVGGLLHLKFMGGTGRPSDVTDNTLSSVLAVLDRFKRGVLGNGSKRDDIQARILAHALPPHRGRAVCLAGRSDPGRPRRFQDLLRITDHTQNRDAARLLSALRGPCLGMRSEQPGRRRRAPLHGLICPRCALRCKLSRISAEVQHADCHASGGVHSGGLREQRA